MKYLVLYGAQNLNNKKFYISDAPNLRTFDSTIQTIANARFEGSTVVDKKVNAKELSFYGIVMKTDELTLQDVINDYKKAFNKEDRYLRVSRNYHVFTPMTSSSGWQTAGDATTLEFDNENFQYGDGSVKFDTDVSVASGYTSVYTENATEMNIAPYGNAGGFEMWVYLPQATGVTSLDLSVGNDSSNYYEGSTTEQYDGTLLEAGWNYVSYRFEGMTQTGTPDPFNFGQYVSVKVNYNGTMVDRNNFRLGGVLWEEEDETVNYRSFVKSFNAGNIYYENQYCKFGLSVLAYEGISESTGEFNVSASSNNTTASVTDTITLEGTYTPTPVVTIGINSAINVSGVTLSNTTTGDSVLVSRTYTASEQLIIDTDNRQVTVNGINADYDDVLPRFVLGENDIQVSIQTTGAESVSKETQDDNLTGIV